MKTGLKSLIAALLLCAPLASNAGVFVSVSIAPPPLLVYAQPAIPGPDYVWQPGYWAWDPDVEDYYWVPGTWVLAPEPGFYWTPGYWAWVDTVFVWHSGYWGPHIGYYGGINYGCGYWGHGYDGGYWRDNHFWYNRSVNNVTNVTNVYNTTVVNNYNRGSHVAYNGGDGGVRDRPRPEEEQAARERHFERTEMQERHRDEARRNQMQFASHGDQIVAATPRPAAFSEHDVVRAPAPTNWNRGNRNSGFNGGNRDNAPDRTPTRPRIMGEDQGRDRSEAPGRVIDRRGGDLPSRNSDLERPMPREMPQTQRRRDRSRPIDTPDSPRSMPDAAPRDMPSRERSPHYERMRPIPRDDQPEQRREPIERPERMNRSAPVERSERMNRSAPVERPMPQREVQMQRPEPHGPQREVQTQRAERPAPQARGGQREDRRGNRDN